MSYLDDTTSVFGIVIVVGIVIAVVVVV